MIPRLGGAEIVLAASLGDANFAAALRTQRLSNSANSSASGSTEYTPSCPALRGTELTYTVFSELWPPTPAVIMRPLFDCSKSLAKQGNTTAQYDLGIMYFHGLGVPQNYIRPHMRFNLSALQFLEYGAANAELKALQ